MSRRQFLSLSLSFSSEARRRRRRRRESEFLLFDLLNWISLFISNSNRALSAGHHHH